MGYTVSRVAGLKNSERRAIAFLSNDEDGRLNAAKVFATLNDKRTTGAGSI